MICGVWLVEARSPAKDVLYPKAQIPTLLAHHTPRRTSHNKICSTKRATILAQTEEIGWENFNGEEQQRQKEDAGHLFINRRKAEWSSGMAGGLRRMRWTRGQVLAREFFVWCIYDHWLWWSSSSVGKGGFSVFWGGLRRAPCQCRVVPKEEGKEARFHIVLYRCKFFFFFFQLALWLFLHSFDHCTEQNYTHSGGWPNICNNK